MRTPRANPGGTSRGLAHVPAAPSLAALVLIALVLIASPGLVNASEEDEYAPTTLVYPPFGHCLGIHRATTFHLFIYLGMRTSFDEPAGIAAVKLLSKDDPATDSDDDELTVFGLNSGRCEVIYNTSLYDVEIYGECGSGPGQFVKPLGITADEEGNVFVADTGNDRVVRLRYEDDELRFVKTFGNTGDGPGQFSRPSDVALGASGRLYVADTGNDRVAVMSPVGEPLSVLEGDAETDVALEGPVGIAVVEGEDAWISRDREFVVVSDRESTRLVKLSLDGVVLATVEAGEGELEDARFGYLAVDYYGNVWATDRESSRIHKFDWRLTHVTSVGRPGDGDMEFDEPRGITLWKRFGQVFVSERTGAQYFWIGTEIQNARAEPAAFVALAEESRIGYYLTETSRVTLEVLDDAGNVVDTVLKRRRRAVGENAERWKGRAGSVTRGLPPGRYTLRLTAVPTYSSGQYFQDTAELQVEILPGFGR